MKIPKNDQQTLLESFKSRPAAPTQASRGEVDFAKQLERSGDKVEATIRSDKGTITEGTAYDFLKSEGLNPSEWEITGFRKSQWSGFSGEDMESVRFNFRRVASEESILVPDLSALHDEIKKSRVKKVPQKTGNCKTFITSIADLQVGKVDSLGGTQQLLERLEISLAGWVDAVKKEKPDEIFLFDAGDILENFQNTGSQAQTNDLRLTEQLTVAARILWRWIDAASTLAPSVKVAGVPSNHARIRQGKLILSEPFDDYGIFNITRMADMASVYPEKYSHVEFYTPGDYEDTLALPTLSGPVIGLAHGDQSPPNTFDIYLAKQALNRSPIGQADIIVCGHWHHLEIRTVGKSQTVFFSPTADNGSSWYTNKSGNESKPGVMSIIVDPSYHYGWSGPHIF